MVQPTVQAIVLAAGKSSRFKTKSTKLAFQICGQELIIYPLKALQSLDLPITLVVGYQREILEQIIKKYAIDLTYIEQELQTGTGSAVAVTKKTWNADHILIMNGDVPLVTPDLIKTLIEKHTISHATITFITAYNADPALKGYGRIIHKNDITAIVESADFQGDAATAPYINAGIYLFKRSFLAKFCTELVPNNAKKELYLTDLIKIASELGCIIETVVAPFEVIRGINTLQELYTVEQIKRSAIIDYWMGHGVRFSSPYTTYLDIDVTIGAGTLIGTDVKLTTGARVGEQCIIESGSHIDKSMIADQVHIKSNSIVQESTIGTATQIGPFAHIRSNSSIGSESVIGNFVEVSHSSIANHTKIKHLSYIGNAIIGSHVNIGAGTVICNYNGVTKTKSTTIIEDGALIGGNNSIVAPVTIAHHAMTAAGSTITEHVPEHALGIGRARQINKEHYRTSIPFFAAIKVDVSTMHEES